MDLNNGSQPFWVVVIGLFLTYSLPKIVELIVKRFGEPKINIDTANIQNTLMLYDKLYEKHKTLEKKYEALEERYEKLKDEFEDLEKENERLKGGL